MSKPLVTVITALYNSEDFIEDTVKSVQSQTFQDWEMIMVDDCSTDNSYSLASAMAKRDSRIKLLQLETNAGPAVARNTAIEAGKGRYMAFLDSDDQWLPEKLERQLAFMEQGGYALSCTGYEKMTEEGDLTGQVVMPRETLSYSQMLKSNQIGCLTAIYDTEKIGKVFMPLIRKRQDYGLWLKILKQVPRAHCLQEVLSRYRVRSGSVSSNKFEMLGYNWSLYRDIEKLSVPRSLYYLGWNIIRKVFS